VANAVQLATLPSKYRAGGHTLDDSRGVPRRSVPPERRERIKSDRVRGWKCETAVKTNIAARAKRSAPVHESAGATYL
jgi:hypothetical protein